jgi:hypothetical protein
MATQGSHDKFANLVTNLTEWLGQQDSITSVNVVAETLGTKHEQVVIGAQQGEFGISLVVAATQ